MSTVQTHLLQHEIKDFTSIWSQQGQANIQRLIKTVDEVTCEKQEDAPLLIIIANDDLSDAGPDFVQEKQNALLRDEFQVRAKQFSVCIRKLQAYPGTTVFVGAGSVLGAAWELALSCDYRVFAEPSKHVGFPELEAGFFPVGGWLFNQLASNKQSLAHDWLTASVMTVLQAKDKTFIDELSQGLQVVSYIDKHGAYLQSSLKKRERLIFELNVVTDGSEHLGDVNAYPTMRRMIEDLNKKSAVSVITQVIKHTSSELFDHMVSDVLPSLASHQIFTNQYRSWLIRSCPHVQLSHPKPGPVYICVDQLVPPMACLAALLESGAFIIFVSLYEEDLQQAMEVAFSRLERRFGSRILMNLWAKQVCWFVGEIPRTERGQVITFRVDDVCEIVDQATGQAYQLLRLEGNRSGAERGSAELNQKYLEAMKESSVTVNVIKAIGEPLIIERGANDMPMATIMRSLFLAEILSVTEKLQTDVYEVLNILKEEGWGFASDEQRWEHFLRFRPDVTHDVRDLFASNLFPHEDYLLMSSLREQPNALGAENRRSNQVSSSGLLTQHLQRYVTHIWTLLSHSMRSDQALTHEILLTDALGWPAGLPSPSQLIEVTGLRSLESYVHVNWPNLSMQP